MRTALLHALARAVLIAVCLALFIGSKDAACAALVPLAVALVEAVGRRSERGFKTRLAFALVAWLVAAIGFALARVAVHDEWQRLREIEPWELGTRVLVATTLAVGFGVATARALRAKEERTHDPLLRVGRHLVVHVLLALVACVATAAAVVGVALAKGRALEADVAQLPSAIPLVIGASLPGTLLIFVADDALERWFAAWA